MMDSRSTHSLPLWLFLLVHFGLALTVLLLTQVLFAGVNGSLFSVQGLGAWLRILVGNLHFGIAGTAYVLWPFVLFYSFPLRYRWKHWAQITGRVLFLVLVGLLLAANLFDVPYFQWTLRRSTSEVFGYAGQNFSGGMGALLLQFLHDFWYYFLLFALLEFSLWWITRGIILKQHPTERYWFRQIVLFLVAPLLTLVGMRGGIVTQHKPLRNIDATRYATPDNVGLVVNTPFSILRTLGHSSGLPEFRFFETSEELESVYSPLQYLDGTEVSPLPKDVRNVVLIILESFSEEYVGALNGSGRGWTPFLDSLVARSRVYEGFANGKRSIESLPSLFSGIPSLMDEAFITSSYAQDRTRPLPLLLKEKGYATAFFHGAYNGSMNFDAYCQSVGVQDYFGMDEYKSSPRSKDDYGCGYAGFDGTWGIFDEPFLQFAAHRLNDYSRPFFATIYTISSHHPYAIPEPYKGRYPKGEQPVIETIGYADHALSEFFRTAQKQPWFQHTLFVVTADHAAQPLSERYATGEGKYRVPMLFYCPSMGAAFAGKTNRMMQHIDFYPTVVDLLGISDTVVSFGHSVLRPAEDYHVSYGDGGYQLLRSGRITHFDGQHAARYDVKNDPLQRSPLASDHDYDADLLFLKALLQQYSERLRQNRLMP